VRRGRLSLAPRVPWSGQAFPDESEHLELARREIEARQPVAAFGGRARWDSRGQRQACVASERLERLTQGQANCSATGSGFARSPATNSR
jgi:hypothetical protein